MKKRIIKFKIAKRNLYRKIYQFIADKIIIKLQNSETQEEFDHWYSIGVYLNDTACNKNIYLK